MITKWKQMCSQDLKCVYVPFWSVLMSSSLSASFSVTVDSSCCEVCRDVVSSPTWQQAKANTSHYTVYFHTQTDNQLWIISYQWSSYSLNNNTSVPIKEYRWDCCLSVTVSIAWCAFAQRPVFAAPPSDVWFLPELWQFPCSLSAGCPAPTEGTQQDKYTLLSFMKILYLGTFTLIM